MMKSENPDIKQDWPRPQQFRRSIRLEFSLYISGLMLLLMVITGSIISDKYVDTVTRNVVEKILVQARSYSSPAGKLIIAEEGPDVLLLNNMCKKIIEDNPEEFWAGITNANNVFIAHSDINQVVAARQLPNLFSDKYDDLLHPNENFDMNSDTLYITVPIFERDVLVGRLAIASSVRQIDQARNTTLMTVGTVTLLMILIGIPLTMLLLNRKLQPISIITDRLKNIDFSDISLQIPLNLRNEFGYLAETLRVMGQKLNLAQKEIVEQERIAREMEIAREIQDNILPKSFPQGEGYTFAGTYKSAREVGGDYYDFIRFDDRYLAFLVADVSGKSLPGMLMMLLTRDIVKSLSRRIKDPGRILKELNRELLKNIKKGMFVTMFCGVFDSQTGEFVFASAGHNPLIKVSCTDQNVELIKTRGFPLGMMPPDKFDDRLEIGKLQLRENDWLVQYTDGVNEALNSEGEQFGMERFTELIRQSCRLTPEEMVRKVDKELETFTGTSEQFDDITFLVMKRDKINVDIDDNKNKMREIHAD